MFGGRGIGDKHLTQPAPLKEGGLTRRALLGGGVAAVSLMGSPALSFQPVMYRDFYAPSGTYRGYPKRPSPPDRFEVFACEGIRYGAAARFEKAVAPSDVNGFANLAPDPIEPRALRPVATNVSPQRGAQYAPHSEDCLFLNVYSNWWRGREQKPVMVYFHGGAYSTGSVTDPLNNGVVLADRGDVVVVTVNHRLNAFGYLYLPDRFPDSGNNGQLDLILALKWVQRNISAFGGDPDNVTVFGQSGGGAKIATLMAMPEAKGLFHKAITMSGQQVTASGPLNARKRAAAFLDKLGADVDPATAPVEALVEALSATDPILGGSVYFGPVLDMRNLTRHPFWPDAAPQSNHIPMMLGNTISETRAFFAPDKPPLLGLNMDNLAERIGPEMRVDIDPHWVVAQFRARYPQDDATRLFHRIVTAARSWRGQVEEAEARARTGLGNTYVYQLDFKDAKHTDDIALAFGTHTVVDNVVRTMSNTVMDAFVRFAKTGNPGWEAYELHDRKTMIFDRTSSVENNPRGWERQLFARVPYIQPGS